MKLKVAIPVIILSYILGVFTSDYRTRHAVDNANQTSKIVRTELEKTFSELDSIRALDKLKNRIDSLGYLINREKSGAPYKTIIEGVSDDLKKDLIKVEKSLEKIDDKNKRENTIFYIKKAKDLLEESEYFL